MTEFNNRADDTRAEMDAEGRQQPPRYHRADNADDDISEQAEAAALDDQAGEPAGNGAYDKPNDNGLEYPWNFPRFETATLRL